MQGSCWKISQTLNRVSTSTGCFCMSSYRVQCARESSRIDVTFNWVSFLRIKITIQKIEHFAAYLEFRYIAEYLAQRRRTTMNTIRLTEIVLAPRRSYLPYVTWDLNPRCNRGVLCSQGPPINHDRPYRAFGNKCFQLSKTSRIAKKYFLHLSFKRFYHFQLRCGAKAISRIVQFP